MPVVAAVGGTDAGKVLKEWDLSVCRGAACRVPVSADLRFNPKAPELCSWSNV